MNKLQAVISLLVGVCLSVTFANHVTPFLEWSSVELLLLGLYFVAIFSGVAYGLIFRLSWCWLSNHSQQEKLVLGIVSFLIGTGLIAVIPIHIPIPPLFSDLHTLEIVATGQKNSLSLGSEVWVTEIQQGDGYPIAIDELDLIGEWELRDGIPISYQSQPASLKWNGRITYDLEITLLSHPWSGVVELIWDGQVQKIDLYSESSSAKHVTFIDRNMASSRIYIWGGLLFNYAVSLSTITFIVLAWLITRPVRVITEVIPVSRWAWLYYALPMIAVWSIWLLAFWPGLMSPDSIVQWAQMVSGNYNDWHPVFHTLTNWLITRLWFSPAAVALAQIFALSIVVGIGLMRLQAFGLSRKFCWAIAFLFALSPANGVLSITLWKDIPYAIAMLALTLIILEIIESDGQWLNRPFRWVLFGIIIAFVSLYRHGGQIIGFGTLLFVILSYRPLIRPLILSLMVGLTIWLAVKIPIYHILDVQTVKPPIVEMAVLRHVSAHVLNNTQFTTEDWAFLSEFRLDNHWPYNCYTQFLLFRDGNFNWKALEQPAVQERLIQIWWHLFLKKPSISANYMICNSSIVWRITSPGYDYFSPIYLGSNHEVLTITENQLGLEYQPILPSIAPFLMKIYLNSIKVKYSWFLWRPVFYLYLLLFSISIAIVRVKEYRYFLIAIPVLFNSAIIMVLTPAQDVRYQYPIYIVGLLMSIYLLNCSSKKDIESKPAPNI